ncbi:MAG TPA: prepilin-type N-terminal cleavage/methylation domain-containing protein [Deltaproteobacteria bacterium]|nr:prepilin-type N-terminal cleavage/methylation domain-containing protein [Deltaproteobacteria bacterium]HPJ95142.1 prepilin-type N-terminal cleavage/methylation domain-containing protein [Deltaproteobacteria bacterium]HPR52987.1 prepilin-type N-terminal cleavage/methylation domain-containing protein [Deltaproteobacteria bacterium]
MMSKGVTLLELMVVLVIISVMAAIALPDLRVFASRRTLGRQGDELVAILNRSREMAMEQGITWRVLFSPEEQRCISFGDKNADSQIDPGEEQIGPFYLSEGISYGSLAPSGPNKTTIPSDGVSFTSNRTSFSYMGCCNAGTVYLKSEDRSLAIRLMPSSGMVRMWEYDMSWQVVK